MVRGAICLMAIMSDLWVIMILVMSVLPETLFRDPSIPKSEQVEQHLMVASIFR